MDIEKMNEYNARQTDFGDFSEVEFYYEKDNFDYFVDREVTRRDKKRSMRGADSIKTNVFYFFNMFDTLSVDNVKRYINTTLDNGLMPTTINTRLSALKTYLKFLSEKYNSPDLLKFPIKQLKVQPKQFIENVISRADFEFLINEARKDLKHPNIYLGCKIMGTTGVRRSELYQVKVEHIKYGYLDVIGKGGKQRRIYFPKKARGEILEYLSELGVNSGYVIRRWDKNSTSNYFTYNTRDGGKLDELKSFDRLFHRQLEYAGKRLGISKELMHAHGFRHFFAKEFLKNRLDISLLADLLGHSSIEITRIYLRMTSREQADVVDEVVDW